MDLNQLLPAVATAFATSLLFFGLWYLLFLRGIKKRLKNEYDEKLLSLELETNSRLEEKLQAFKENLMQQNHQAIAALEQELKAVNSYELGLLKAKLKNTQPSYPKKLEAAQKLAVLLNSISSAPALAFADWKQQLQQYLISYTGIVSPDTEAAIDRALHQAAAEDLDGFVEELTRAKGLLKEARIPQT